MTIDRGSVVITVLDPTLGHEQKGARPCLTLGDPEVARHQRYPMVCVVPLTRTPGQGALYPEISPATASGPAKTSHAMVAMVDQLRSLDKRRTRRLLGRIPAGQLEAVEEGVRLFLGVFGQAGGITRVLFAHSCRGNPCTLCE